jgi:hypothetical protein
VVGGGAGEWWREGVWQPQVEEEVVDGTKKAKSGVGPGGNQGRVGGWGNVEHNPLALELLDLNDTNG